MLRAHSGHSGHSGQIFWHHVFIKIQKLKIYKILKLMWFWKCGKKSLFHTRCFIMPHCIKNTIFVNLCGGCTFKLTSMYYMRLFFIYTLSLKHKVNLSKKDKRPNLYNKKILVLDTVTLWDYFLIILFHWTISKSIRKNKRPNLYNKKILVLDTLTLWDSH